MTFLDFVPLGWRPFQTKEARVVSDSLSLKLPTQHLRRSRMPMVQRYEGGNSAYVGARTHPRLPRLTNSIDQQSGIRHDRASRLLRDWSVLVGRTVHTRTLRLRSESRWIQTVQRQPRTRIATLSLHQGLSQRRWIHQRCQSPLATLTVPQTKKSSERLTMQCLGRVRSTSAS